ncbi:cell envelope-related function transcriptional attenuator common domain-containing protein [Nonomuraea maritima]|uniref:Cell envelope-related function transcriptional attenuator common domain-containing protein n=1 Tax=Nonomuraea maritima TaxID=683260 RepID=A0A1G9AGW8_9ACTN|nr:LCP family protein [Nonomuraea maritima]SDK25755.1 cell envelope-related function transcriptional attenuator common domain-containing protein [Nonomuraea maritima]
MRDPGGEDGGVLVGGDAYGGVKLAPVRVRRPRRSARARRRNVVIAGLLSTGVLVATGVVWATPRQIGTVDAGVTAVARGAENILLVGVDKRDDLTREQQNRLKLGRESGQRTDTMMVVHLSEDHKKVTVVSLPRDTWTTVPGKGEHKINSAYQFGGPRLAKETVEAATGLQINRYIEVNILGFIDVVDSLGGITVCTPVPINDAKIKLQLAAGTHQLDGVQALYYARTRATARSDLDRIDRQQQVISALLNRALSADTLANPAKLTAFVNSTLSTVKVDPDDGLVGLATQLRDVSLGDVTFADVPLADVDYRTSTGESAVLWDKRAARDMFARIDADQDPSRPTPTAVASPSPKPSGPAPKEISVKVTNGTLVNGLGARTKTALVAYGFKVPDHPGNTKKQDFRKTMVRYGAGQEAAAKVVAAAIPGAELRETDAKGIEVVLGSDQPKVRQPKPSSPPSAKPSVTPTTETAMQNICK